MKKVLKALSGVILIVVLSTFPFIIDSDKIPAMPVINSIICLFLGWIFPIAIQWCIDCSDLEPWQTELRKLKRAKIIQSDESIRISFAYLFRIQVDDKYLLVKNGRGTQKYQPVGGAYKYNDIERLFLSSNFNIIDDNNIKIDDSSRSDYRLRVPVKYLKKFVRRFDKTKDREKISNLKREFEEELINTDILSFANLQYRYCGRHLTPIEYSKYFKCYELLLADIVEVILSDAQKVEIRGLIDKESAQYLFATEEEIKACGVHAGTSNMLENIGDHTQKILQCEGSNLIKPKEKSKIYRIRI